MAIGIFLSPSSQWWNKCVFGDTEEQHCREIAQEIKILFDKDNRFNCKVCPEFFNMTENQRLEEAVRISDEFCKSFQIRYHIALHTDGFNGNSYGCSAFYIGNGKGKGLASILARNFDNISPWSIRSLEENQKLFEIRKPLASSVLFEMNFHDEAKQANWLHLNIKNIAKVFYLSILQNEGLKEMEEVKVDNEQWKKDLVQECLNLGLLKDTAWLNKANDSIPVFAVCAMITQLYKLHIKK